MPRVKPQKNGPGQMIRYHAVREIHSLEGRHHTPDSTHSVSTAKASSVMPSDEGTSAFLPRNPRNLTMFSKRVVMVTPPKGGQCRFRGIVLRDGIGIEILTRCRLRQLANDAGANLPTAALDRGLLLAIADFGVVLGRAQLAFDFHVVALLQVLRVVGGLAEGDYVVPLGMVHPLLRLL